MSSVLVVYSRSATVGGVLIRAASWGGQWSHCGLVTPQDTVLEARAFHGVTESSSEDFLARTTVRQTVEIACPDPEAAYRFYRERLGQGYDYGAILGILAREPLDSRKRWHCSEILESALAAGGNDRFRYVPWRISPNHSYMVR